MKLYDRNEPDNRTPEQQIEAVDKRLAEFPRLRKQEEERREQGATPEEIDKQLGRIAFTEDFLTTKRMELVNQP